MTLKPITTLAAAAIASLLAVMPFDPAAAGGGSGSSSAPHCKTGGSSVTINKPVNIYKPVTINNNISIYKPVTINKNIDIQNNVDIQKNISIVKNIMITNSASVTASATASASAAASSSSSARAGAMGSANANAGATYYGSYSEENVYYHGAGGDIGSLTTSQGCEMQEATVVKALHAMCVAEDGREFPASHMVPATFLDASYEGEIVRCIPGAHLKVTIGDVVQSDQGMAGTYEHGAVLMCADHEALRHYKNGMLKCEAALPVKDCTERTNLRKYGTADIFFSFRTKVCAVPARQASQNPVELTGMTLEGGVGEGK